MLHVYQCEKCNCIKAFKEEPADLTGLVKLVPHDLDETNEKHVPVVDLKDNKAVVTVGSVLHPMTEAHLISDVILETSLGVKHVKLTHEDQPVATFDLEEGEKVIAAYDWCNLHGLWVKVL